MRDAATNQREDDTYRHAFPNSPDQSGAPIWVAVDGGLRWIPAIFFSCSCIAENGENTLM
jgi:hypothetical protein